MSSGSLIRADRGVDEILPYALFERPPEPPKPKRQRRSGKEGRSGDATALARTGVANERKSGSHAASDVRLSRGGRGGNGRQIRRGSECSRAAAAFWSSSSSSCWSSPCSLASPRRGLALAVRRGAEAHSHDPLRPTGDDTARLDRASGAQLQCDFDDDGQLEPLLIYRTTARPCRSPPREEPANRRPSLPSAA